MLVHVLAEGHGDPMATLSAWLWVGAVVFGLYWMLKAKGGL